MEFKDRLRAIRKEKELTQRELADIIKSNNNTVSNWEKGVSRPTMPVIETIANALRVSPFDLIGDFTLGELRSAHKKSVAERTTEEEIALTFAKSPLKALNISFNDELTLEQAAMSIKSAVNELTVIKPEEMLENGGYEILLAVDSLNMNAKNILLDFISGLLRVPAYLDHPEDGIDEKTLKQLEDLKRLPV